MSCTNVRRFMPLKKRLTLRQQLRRAKRMNLRARRRVQEVQRAHVKRAVSRARAVRFSFTD